MRRRRPSFSESNISGERRSQMGNLHRREPLKRTMRSEGRTGASLPRERHDHGRSDGHAQVVLVPDYSGARTTRPPLPTGAAPGVREPQTGQTLEPYRETFDERLVIFVFCESNLSHGVHQQSVRLQAGSGLPMPRPVGLRSPHSRRYADRPPRAMPPRGSNLSGCAQHGVIVEASTSARRQEGMKV